jgi:hypothetical protein
MAIEKRVIGHVPVKCLAQSGNVRSQGTITQVQSRVDRFLLAKLTSRFIRDIYPSISFPTGGLKSFQKVIDQTSFKRFRLRCASLLLEMLCEPPNLGCQYHPMGEPAEGILIS